MNVEFKYTMSPNTLSLCPTRVENLLLIPISHRPTSRYIQTPASRWPDGRWASGSGRPRQETTLTVRGLSGRC